MPVVLPRKTIEIFSRARNPEDYKKTVFNILGTLDDHHGLRDEWSSDVSVQVVGVALSARLEEAFRSFGTFEFHPLGPTSIEARRLPEK